MPNKTDKITPHFTYGEIIDSHIADRYKINNEPSVEQLGRIKLLLEHVVEPARIALDKPFQVNSIFRSQKVNERAKGAGTSQHLANNGAAIDFECSDLGNQILFDWLYKNANYDQLIWEYGDKNAPDWVHVSYVSDKSNRKQTLQCVKYNDGSPKYIPYKK